MSEYAITMKMNASDEPFLTAIVEDVKGGKIVKSIIQNQNISDVVQVDVIKEFMAKLNGTTVDELPPLDGFLADNVKILPAKSQIGGNYISEIDL